jgi:L,D-peptidoglycan transpeptidase YkuD (ErfK/YbiS/YcfS/YnhG family)
VRAWLRWAAAGTVAVGLLPFGGLEPAPHPRPAPRPDAPVPVTGGLPLARLAEPAEPSGSPSPSAPPSSAPPSSESAAASSVASTAGPSPRPSRAATPATARQPAAPATTPVAAPPPASTASRLHTIPAGTRQLIVVTTNGYGTSSATIETFSKVNGVWQPAFAAMSGWIGSKGFSDNHVEGDPTTPTGVYGIGSTMYGIGTDPGVRYGYHQLVTGDYWDENPDSPTYNSFVHGVDPGAGSEALWQVAPQYNYFAVIDYNIPAVPANPPRGSAIFLHVVKSGGTAGCVALGQSDLVRVLDWLDPAASPRIVMTPTENLGRY